MEWMRQFSQLYEAKIINAYTPSALDEVVLNGYHRAKKIEQGFMASLKDALLKAGMKATEAPKKQNEREKIAKKNITETVSHQIQRNFCENCNQVRPDVEFYKHRNPTTEAEWICVKCADQLQILDKFRQTAQSETSIKKMFRREYGETIKIALAKDAVAGINKSKGDVNGNR
jgi:hypothetical protein